MATLQYIEAHTHTPVPHAIHHMHHSAERGGDSAHSPYIMMSKVDRSLLSSIRDDMGDSERQAVVILLESYLHRSDKIRTLFTRDGVGKDAWHIKSS